MKGLENNTFLLLYIIANILAIILLIVSWKRPNTGRLLFFLLFSWASITNWTTVLKSPQVYTEYADLTFFDFYRRFILGWFSNHILISVGFVATCQALIAISMWLKRRLMIPGAIGSIVFLFAIAPLGVGSGFPCTLIMAWAMMLVVQKSSNEYLWTFLKRKKSAS